MVALTEILENNQRFGRAYALLDSSPLAEEVGALRTYLLKTFAGIQIRSLYEDVPQDMGEVEPLLVDLSNAPQVFHKWLEKYAKEYSFAGVVWSNNTLLHTAEHLESLLDQRIPPPPKPPLAVGEKRPIYDDPEQDVVFRFYDPRITKVFFSEATPEQQAQFAGDCISAWGVWDRCGKWLQILIKPSGKPENYDLKITQDQINKIDVAQWPDQIISRIDDYDAGILFEIPYCQRYKNVVKHMQVAYKKYKLQGVQDLGLYVILALEFQDGWQLAMPFSELLKKAKGQTGKFSEGIEEVQPKTWHIFQQKYANLIPVPME